jgi:hypothetical protein
MIKNISAKAKDIFTPLDTEITKIIPNIVIKQQITTAVIPPATTGITYDLYANFKIIIINMDKFDYKTIPFKSLMLPTATKLDYPVVIGINNGNNDMVNRDSSFNKGFLQDLYVPIAFSNHGQTDNKKYNIILLRKDAIEYDTANNPEYLETLQPIDQSTRFVINELPEGMILENNQKSFTIANIIFNKTTDATEGISIVCTDLVGSNPNDLYHARQIIDFNLRAKQIQHILDTTTRFTGRLPDFIIGDMGGCPANIITQLIDPTPTPTPGLAPPSETYKDHLWNYFTKTHPDFIPNFNNADALEIFFTDGFDLLTSYNADSYIPTNLITPITTGPNYTKKILNTLSNYIFYQTNINQSTTIPTPISKNELYIEWITNFLTIVKNVNLVIYTDIVTYDYICQYKLNEIIDSKFNLGKEIINSS